MTRARSIAVAFACALAQSVAATESSVETLDLAEIGSPAFHIYDERDGLPNNVVVALDIDARGYLWASTLRGVARYDGHAWELVRDAEDRLQNGAVAIAHLDDGSVWIATESNGLVEWHDGVTHYVDKRSGLPGDQIACLRAPASPSAIRLFACTSDGGLAALTVTGWHRYEANDGWPNGAVAFDVAEVGADSARRTYAGLTDGGVLELVENHWRVVARAEPHVCACQLHRLLATREPDGSDAFWIATLGDAVHRYAHGEWTTIGADAIGSERVYALYADSRDGAVWAGTRHGLELLRGGTWHRYARGQGLPNDRVHAIVGTRSPEGIETLWLATEGGIARATSHGGDWLTIGAFGLQGDGVWSVLTEPLADGNERVWVASDGDGVAAFEHHRWRRFGRDDGLSSDIVRSLALAPDADGQTRVWAGTWDGQVLRFDGTRFESLEVPWKRDASNTVLALLADRDANGASMVWIGTRGNGLARYENGRVTPVADTGAPRSGRVSALLHTRDARGRDILWVGMLGDGVYWLRESEWHHLDAAHGLADDALLSLAAIAGASEKELWIGTARHGVARYAIDGDEPTPIVRADMPALPNRTIFAVGQAQNKNVYVCTGSGVLRLAGAPSGETPESRVFTTADGLPHDECNAGAMHVDASGRVWIGTVGGAAVLDPASEIVDRTPKPLAIEHVRVDGLARTVPANGTLELAHGDGALEIDVGLLALRGEHQTRYRSQLVGLESAPGAWTAEATRQYVALPPGDYRFVVEARDYAGNVSGPVALDIAMNPAPWQTTWARLLFVGAAALTIAWIVLRRLKAHERRERMLVEVVRKRTRELEARSVELHKANHALTRLSYVDPLTGLANRRLLLERLDEEYTYGREFQRSVGFILFDIDDFKRYNDRHGHLAGDDCLAALARVVERALGESNALAGRYGGEEFGVIVPGASLDDATALAERLRVAVETLAIAHADDIERGVVTISCGVSATVPARGGDHTALIACADAALYRAKHNGKNQVVADTAMRANGDSQGTLFTR